MNSELIKNIREDLASQLSEWVGIHVPDEEDEDYLIWKEKLNAINAIHTIEDVIAYAECYIQDSDEFLRKWGMID